jgi:hypothetical protein
MYKLLELYKQWKGAEPANVQQIPGGGSNRTYFRLTDTDGKTVIGVIGYKVWKDPTKKLIKLGFISGIVLFVLSVLPVLLTGHIDDSGNPLLFADSAVTLVIAIGYIIGAIIVRANYKLAREKRVS